MHRKPILFVAKHGEGYTLTLKVAKPVPVAIDPQNPQAGTVLRVLDEAQEVVFSPRFLTSRALEVGLATFYPDRALVSGMQPSQQPTQIREYEWVQGNGIDDDVLFEVLPTRWAAASDARTLMSAFDTGVIPVEHREWYNRQLLEHGALGRDFVEVTAEVIQPPWAKYNEIKGQKSWEEIERLAEAISGEAPIYHAILRYEQTRDEPRKTVVEGCTARLTELSEQEAEARLLQASMP